MMFWLREILSGLSTLGLWVREIAGWLLMLFGLFVLYVCYQYLESQRVIEAGPLIIVGVVIFRGGIHLLKVSLAARICLEARDRSKPQRQTPRPVPPAAKFNRLVNR
jgi:hypothetical protein